MNSYFIVVDSNPETGAPDEVTTRELPMWSMERAVDKAAPHQPYHRELHGTCPISFEPRSPNGSKPGARILEAGWGWDNFTVAAHALVTGGGLDWSEKTIHSLSQLFPHIPGTLVSAASSEFDDGAFDASTRPAYVSTSRKACPDSCRDTASTPATRPCGRLHSVF